jgi:hypothetical protein
LGTMMGLAAAKVLFSSLEDLNTVDLMVPVHAVATAIRNRGERPVEEIEGVEGINLESMGVVKDCAKLAAQFLCFHIISYSLHSVLSAYSVV